jgi:Lon protease-like protein
MNKNGIFEIALFPIPGCVSFPQTTVPLHVFEPRYRLMVEECVAQNKLLGVCHTKSIERFASGIPMNPTNEKELYNLYKQNLSTFSPEDVFSAGMVEITQKTPDGRYLISIQMLKRFRILDIAQDTPYKIGKCEEYNDFEMISFKDANDRTTNQRIFILNFLKDQMHKQGLDVEDLLSDLESELTINNFTFKLFKFYKLPDLQMQQLLNSKDPFERLSLLHNATVMLKG